MFEDFKELLRLFSGLHVRYLIVGGYAVSLHSQPRATKDLDLLVRPDPENARSVYAALLDFGAPLGGFTSADFSDEQKFFRMGRAPIMVDILSRIDGVDFESAWERRVEATIDAESGQTAFFLSSADLIASKLAAGRPQDLADAAAIRAAQGEAAQS